MKYIYLLVILLITSSVFGQDVNHFVHIGITANAYKGDLQNSYDKWGSSFHAGLKFNKKKRLNGAFTLSIGSVSGQNTNPVFVESENSQPNSFFKSNIISGQYDLLVNLIKTEQWALFISQGAGLVRFNPKDDLGNDLIRLANTRAANEEYNNISIMFPTQVGASYILKNNFGFALQGGFLNTMSDYIDNISKLGTKSGNDNVFIVRFSLLVPVHFKEKALQ